MSSRLMDSSLQTLPLQSLGTGSSDEKQNMVTLWGLLIGGFGWREPGICGQSGDGLKMGAELRVNSSNLTAKEWLAKGECGMLLDEN